MKLDKEESFFDYSLYSGDGDRSGGEVTNLNGLFLAFCRNIQSVFRSERGQTLVEHGLLLGISSTVIGIFQNDLTIALAVTALVLIILLLWKPRTLVTIAVIAVLLTVLFFAYRFVKYGHI